MRPCAETLTPVGIGPEVNSCTTSRFGIAASLASYADGASAPAQNPLIPLLSSSDCGRR